MRNKMTKMIEVISGKVEQDICGSWSDFDPRLYLGFDVVETIFTKYRGKIIKATIEEIELKQEA
jgi:hypothetical protein